MENFDQGAYRQGTNIALAGTSEHPMYFIAAADYAKMVSRAFQRFDGSNADYIIQGTEAYTANEAAHIFAQNYTQEKMKVMTLPFWMLRFFGRLSPKFNYGANIVEALNKYPEQFQGKEAWDALGKPQITLKQYAQQK